jgi:release factor glutamine methyltransferase
LSAGVFSASTTRAEALAILADRFRDGRFETPVREARSGLLAACRLSAAALIAAPTGPLGGDAARLADFAARRLTGEPLSRIVGAREFWGLSLAVSQDVLDPRPETETIVEAAVAIMRDRREEELRILDLGTGSGALLCALLSEFRSARGVGADLSEAAAAVARGNVETCNLGKRATIRVGNWTEGVTGPFDLIVSNPPYIPTAAITGLPREVRDHDPLLALDGGIDGLDAYRAIIPGSVSLLAPGARLILEVGNGQASDVLTLMADAGLVRTSFRRDLAGVERVVAAQRETRTESERAAHAKANVICRSGTAW